MCSCLALDGNLLMIDAGKMVSEYEYGSIFSSEQSLCAVIQRGVLAAACLAAYYTPEQACGARAGARKQSGRR